MGIVAAYAVPHPPLIIPSVGRGQQNAIERTIDSLQKVAAAIAAAKPQTIVIISPHAPAFRDGFFISQDSEESGSMAAFGHPQENLTIPINRAFASALAKKAESRGIPVAGAPVGLESIDHGAYVPLYFLKQVMDLASTSFVRLGLSGLPAETHREFGRLIAEVAADQGGSTVIIASGDWSHRLKEDGPYGFVEEGPQFDCALAAIFREGDLSRLFALDPQLCASAGECGLHSFQIMAGALEGSAFEGGLLSYEGPFGVGYGVAAFEALDAASSAIEGAEGEVERCGMDPLVALARQTVESYCATGTAAPLPDDMPEEYLHERAGVFVSLHELGELRGCIGTIEPRQDSIAEEVRRNAVSACSADPRFPPVSDDELDYLSYSVDVLGEAEAVASLTELDPKRYGVIVSKGWKRGLLLPDLEGVDTPFDQIAIARRKAGIGPDEDVIVERFEVIRHCIGGAARKG